MKKTATLLTTLLLTATASLADDLYRLSYTKDTNCTLLKNGKIIPLFDPAFKSKAPANSYTCNAIQKEQYNDCKILKTQNTTAQVFSFGVYDYTNLIMAFKTPTKHTSGMMEVQCTKSLKRK